MLSNLAPRFGKNAVTIGVVAVLALPGFAAWAQDDEGIVEQLGRLWKGASLSPDALVAAELRSVERVSGLQARGPLRAELLDRAGAERHIVKIMEQQLPPVRLAALDHLYHALGFLPVEVRLGDAVRALYASQAGGFYDPGSRTLHLLDDLPTMVQGTIVRHELVHALQDQHFGLAKWVQEVSADEDRALAVQALLEGHATDVMNRLTADAVLGVGDSALSPDVMRAELEEAMGGLSTGGRGGGSDGDIADLVGGAWALGLPEGTPAVLAAQLLFPYTTGAQWVAGHRARHPDDVGLRLLYKRPPSSTAEVLEPELWERGFQPTLRSPGTLVPGFHAVLETAVGRLNIAVLMSGQGDPNPPLPARGGKDPPDPDRIAAVGGGWRGDRVAVLATTPAVPGTLVPESWSLLWATQWESPALAQAVARRFRDRLPHALVAVEADRVDVVVPAVGVDHRHLFAALSSWR